jgi:hypothetical protein
MELAMEAEVLENGKTVIVTMPLEDWEKMQERLLWLDSLEEAGVDNWEGIEYALEAYRNATKEQK